MCSAVVSRNSGDKVSPKANRAGFEQVTARSRNYTDVDVMLVLSTAHVDDNMELSSMHSSQSGVGRNVVTGHWDVL